MTHEKFNAPQPLPYPESWVMKQLFRFPILLYRLSLGKLIGKTILILSTRGRKSGKVRRAAVEYFKYKSHIYVISGFGDQPDWYRNMKADPHVSINTDQGVIHAIAHRPTTEEEWRGAIAYLRHSPIPKLTHPEMLTKLDEPEVLVQIKTWPFLTFDPTNEPCPSALEADLVWTWPLILLLLAINILVGWLIHKKQ